MIWRSLSRTRAVQDGAAELHQAAGAGDQAWPGPVIDFLLGGIDAGRLQALADQAGPADRTARGCEASAYIGERALLSGDREMASRQFRQAQALCPPDYIEHDLAALELQSLAQAL